MSRELTWSLVASVISCLAVVAAIILAREVDLEYLFMADALYLPSIYYDIVHGAGWAGLQEWLFNPAPNFFPDMGLFLALNGLLGDLRLATYAFALVQLVVILVLVRAIARTSGLVQSDTGIALGILLMSLLALMGQWGGDFNITFQLLVNSYHTGAFVNTLLGVLLLIRWLQRGRAVHLVLLGLVIFLAAASDKLFWAMFLLPTIAVQVILLLRVSERKRLAIALGVLILAAWCADRGLRTLDQAFSLNIASPYAYLELDRITRSWGKFVEMYQWFLQGPLLMRWCTLLPLAATAWASYFGIRTLLVLVRHQPDAGALPTTTIRLLCAAFFPAVLLAPILNGSFDGGDSIRYNYSVYMLAPLVLGMVIGNLLPRLTLLVMQTGTPLYGLFLLGTCASHDASHALRFRPQRVILLDTIAREQGLRNGVANYWDAKVITLFSETGLYVLPAYPDLAMFLQVNRESMFLRTATEDPVVFDFVVAHDQLTPASVTAALTSPVHVVRSGSVVAIRTRPWTYDPSTRQPRQAAITAPLFESQ